MHTKSDFERPVRRWQDIPGWFQWRSAQEEAVAHFGDGSRFAEVGCYLGKSLCSLAEVIRESRPRHRAHRGRHRARQRP